MSDNIPYEIQVEIIKRLPVKSLIQARSVSKAWKSLIDSSDFIARYSIQHTQQQHLLVSYEDSERKYVSFVDDDTFPQEKVFLTIHPLISKLRYTSIIGSSRGLLCLYGNYQEVRGGRDFGTDMVVLWNPSIRKVAIVVHSVPYVMYATILGFGFCRETTELKIVKITHIKMWTDIESIPSIPCQVEVFTLRTGGWRSPHRNLPRKSIIFGYSKVAIRGFFYWLATDRITLDGEFRSYNLIISFDMTSEEFDEINLPDGLAHNSDHSLSISKLRDHLVVLEPSFEANNLIFGVWMMTDGVPKSFTKLYTTNTPDALIRGFRKSGELLVEIEEQGYGLLYGASLVVCEPYSKHIINLGVNGVNRSFYVFPYIQTLLLLNQPNFSIYDKGKRIISNHIA